MAAFDQVVGKKTVPLDAAALASRIAAASTVLIDVGTGQGKFVLDSAREDPARLCIGIDAAAENMVKIARRASASPKKGGTPNAVFLRAAAESLPGPLEGTAATLTVQYPWGSLMRIVAEPLFDGLSRLRQTCRPGASLSVLLNQSVFEDREYLERLGMGDVSDPALSDRLPEVYADAGFIVTRRESLHGDPPVRTAWGRHLVRGSGRTTLVIEATASRD